MKKNRGAYKAKKTVKSQMTSIETVEGEPIEWKVERLTSNKEPIKDGAPEIFTERKDGVVSGYNIRTDRWEVATDAMDKVQKSVVAKREEKAKAWEEQTNKESGKVIDLKDSNIEDKSIQGGDDKKSS